MADQNKNPPADSTIDWHLASKVGQKEPDFYLLLNETISNSIASLLLLDPTKDFKELCFKINYISPTYILFLCKGDAYQVTTNEKIGTVV